MTLLDTETLDFRLCQLAKVTGTIVARARMEVASKSPTFKAFNRQDQPTRGTGWPGFNPLIAGDGQL